MTRIDSEEAVSRWAYLWEVFDWIISLLSSKIDTFSKILRCKQRKVEPNNSESAELASRHCSDLTNRDCGINWNFRLQRVGEPAIGLQTSGAEKERTDR